MKAPTIEYKLHIMTYTIKKISNLSIDQRNAVLQKWSNGLCTEKHTLNETAIDLYNNLHIGVALFYDNAFLGAAGIFPARNTNNKTIHYSDKKVLELGSIFIEKKLRGKSLGRKLVEATLQEIDFKKYFVVAVTTNPAMQKVFEKTAGYIMTEQKLNKQLCLCSQDSHDPLSCPLEQDASWYFKDPTY